MCRSPFFSVWFRLGVNSDDRLSANGTASEQAPAVAIEAEQNGLGQMTGGDNLQYAVGTFAGGGFHVVAKKDSF